MTATLADQAATLACLANLAVGHPNLPAAYITTSRFTPRELSVQLDSPGKVEAWREALGIPAESVFESRIGNRQSLEFRASAYGVLFHVYAAYLPATVGNTPQAA
ncbi:hypothetical protein [Streptomyces sp. SCSIO ZS0520]|uniref:hypothetical protein n=1 Tax=Streptomyces sp. SCSIO ZS0520 TaxID=2892996 RepID=UPI0021D856B1|nr:hypothetical protein [Streptomyces sp. SCSIO ZS0520]